ncbi:hypothetical protein [Brevundimonas subvibrioides]|uniref:hypothetical protein n=1 Tax=Brevundimonas subvibrioides TaxID=74313 RepID=UPI0022B35DB0|nr:hypothetical protein [Brevundimonas subvibrioides]
MAALSVAHRAVLAQMLERVPGSVLDTLSMTVGQLPGERARALSQMLADETADRQRRAVVFAPLLPMFAPRPDGVAALTFPSSVLPRVWKAATAREPNLMHQLNDVRFREDDPKVLAVANRICIAASGVIRDQPDIIWPAADWDEDTRAEGLRELAACFDLAILARSGIAALPALIARPTEAQLAELRLMVRDAGEIARDGGPRLLEILFGHLTDAALILRLVINSSRTASQEGMLSASEMAVFVNRLIAAVEARVTRIAAFKPGRTDPSAGVGVEDDIIWCGEILAELDRTLKLAPEGAWGKSARDARARINGTLSDMLTSTDRVLDKVLPTRRVNTTGRMTREAAALDQMAGPDVIETTRVMLTLVGAIRSSAQVFGCESLRHQLVTTVVERLSTYADLVMEAVNAGEAPNASAALQLVETLAQFLVLIDATEPAKTARRRAAAAKAALATATPEASPRAA